MRDMELVLRGAKILGRDSICDIAIYDGKISEISENLQTKGTNEIDVKGKLVAPTYVNGHVHLDKCNLGEVMRPNETYSFQECLEITWEHKRKYTVNDIVDRASRAIEEGILNGTTIFRVFADVDTIGGLKPLEGVLALREKWQGIVDIEVVNFPQEAIVRDPGTKELMEEGMRMGADIVGGLPWHEYLDEDMREHIDYCFDLAKKYDKDIHMLVDDTLNPNSRSLEYLAVKTMREGYQGRVSASHCEALAAYEEHHAIKVMNLVKSAGISISTNTHISLALTGRASIEPIPRGITRAKQLWGIGVNVFASQDDVNDPYYPFGSNSQQEVALHLCHAAHMTFPKEIIEAFNFVTYNAAKAMRLDGYGISVGDRADINVLAANTVQHVLRIQQPPPWVIKGGKVLATNVLERQLNEI